MKKENKIAHLELSSYAGIAPLAYHYYARLRFNNFDQTLEKPLTVKEAAEWNKEDRRRGEVIRMWKPGDYSNKFSTKEQAIEFAKEVFYEKLVPLGAKILIKGSYASCDPRPVIAWSEDSKQVAERLNVIAEKAEEIDFWAKDKAQMQKLCDRWDKVLAGL